MSDGSSIALRCIGAAAMLACFSGLPGLLLPRRSAAAQWIGCALMLAAGALGASGAARALLGDTGSLRVGDASPLGTVVLAIDALSAAFILPIFVIGPLTAVYGLGYWPQRERGGAAVRVQAFAGVLIAALAALTLARDAFSLLVAWEAMALSAYFLVTADESEPDSAASGWVYLVATHAATLALVAALIVWHSQTMTWLLEPSAGTVGGPAATVIFLVSLLAFGCKAGVFPLHVWLPGAHASAPSHVSALMSGLLIKLGIYCLLRVLTLLPTPPLWWGSLLIALGIASGLYAMIFSIAQKDMKRVLAYSSVKNIGVILIGVGVALLGRAAHHGEWVLLGLGGALLHVWNHSLFKSLLFMGAGSVVHAVGTRDMNRMGGLAKSMPRTASLFLVGTVAICALPPLNGFVSELLIYVALLRGTVDAGSITAVGFAVPLLALIGALSVASFVRLYGAIFLGLPRDDRLPSAHESPFSMLLPMTLAAVACFAVGLGGRWVMLLVEPAVRVAASDAPLPATAAWIDLRWVGGIGLGLLAAAAVIYALLARVQRRESFRTVGTWDCGYAAPTTRMQYTASASGQILAQTFRTLLRPRRSESPIVEPFPSQAALQEETDDIALSSVAAPLFARAERALCWLRRFQQGRIQLYIVYVFATLIALLVIAMVSP